MTTPTKIVIYTRFSSDMQSPKSCPDQEREVRAALTKMGIDHSDAVVIHDEAESGTRVLRDEFARLTEMIAGKEIRILAVDDQSRLTRADNAFAFITDLVYSGGRFISTGEGIDTTQQGWELRVKVMELHNSTTILELGRRVRRGQLGRVLSGLSAGDFPFGFEAYYLHPEQVREDRRGPKPEKGVRIDEVAARWVRQIFAWFVAQWSIGAIARELNRLGPPGSAAKRVLGRHSMSGGSSGIRNTSASGDGVTRRRFGIPRGRSGRSRCRQIDAWSINAPTCGSSSRACGRRPSSGSAK